MVNANQTLSKLKAFIIENEHTYPIAAEGCSGIIIMNTRIVRQQQLLINPF
ncbi:MAG TPA: hypothetical protein VI278_15940 [Nitrososphaeraceae archaeon]